MNQSEVKLKHDNSELVDENERLNLEILALQKESQSKDETIEFLENRIAKAEASALKTFEDKNREVMTLKKPLKSSRNEHS